MINGMPDPHSIVSKGHQWLFVAWNCKASWVRASHEKTPGNDYHSRFSCWRDCFHDFSHCCAMDIELFMNRSLHQFTCQHITSHIDHVGSNPSRLFFVARFVVNKRPEPWLSSKLEPGADPSKTGSGFDETHDNVMIGGSPRHPKTMGFSTKMVSTLDDLEVPPF